MVIEDVFNQVYEVDITVLARPLRRRPNIKTTLGQRLVFTGGYSFFEFRYVFLYMTIMNMTHLVSVPCRKVPRKQVYISGTFRVYMSGIAYVYN